MPRAASLSLPPSLSLLLFGEREWGLMLRRTRMDPDAHLHPRAPPLPAPLPRELAGQHQHQQQHQQRRRRRRRTRRSQRACGGGWSGGSRQRAYLDGGAHGLHGRARLRQARRRRHVHCETRIWLDLGWIKSSSAAVLRSSSNSLLSGRRRRRWAACSG